MRIPLDPNSSIPLYRQIENWLRNNILNGSLQPGTRLPATRGLSEKLGVSRITIKNAYAALEADGLILTHEGSGTFVAPPLPAQEQSAASDDLVWPLWQTESVFHPSVEEELFPARPSAVDLISFTGVGDSLLSPVKDFARTIQDVLRRDGNAALEYGSFDNGWFPLRRTVVRVLASQGFQARPEDVLITSGSQQALALICQVLLKPGDVVLVEKPTYNLALDLFRTFGLKIMGIPIDENGMQVDLLEPLLQQVHPRLIYTIPNFQNPGGVCMSLPRRRQLLDLAGRYNVPILEDDFAGDLRFEGRYLPAIKSLDAGGRVIYAGTFSKMLMPGLRVGYLIANGPIYERLVQQKRVSDLTTSPLMQRAVHQYVTVGRYQTHLRRSARLYHARRDAMCAALRQFLPRAEFNLPHGGLFLWLKLPEGIPSSELLAFALDAGVEFTPGRAFFSNPAEGERYLRLNFASRTEEEIEKGIQRLGEAFRRLSGSI